MLKFIDYWMMVLVVVGLIGSSALWMLHYVEIY
jgi:hypothetical protein